MILDIWHSYRIEWFNSLSSAQKQTNEKNNQNGVSHWILNKKENFCLAEQNGIKYWILQTKIRLYHKSKLIRKPMETQVNMI